jgi:beta-N-acetylhexosaminidase
MARIWFALFFPMLVLGTAFALPKPFAERSSLLVHVYDAEAPLAWKPTEAECRRWPHWAPDADCKRYRGVHEMEKQPAAVSSSPDQRPTIRRAARAIDLHSRDSRALKSKPLVAGQRTLLPKVIPGESPVQSLRNMVGQLIIAGFAGKSLNNPGVVQAIFEIREGKLSGVIIRASNIEISQQLRQLTSYIARAGSEYPPFIVIDQPGGPDAVLSENKGFAFFSGANAISNATSPYEAQIEYSRMASELATLGVSLNIGPSGDACQERRLELSASCFASNPSLNWQYAGAFTLGHHDSGVLAALRHVPFRAGLMGSWSGQQPSVAMLRGLLKSGASDAIVIRMKATEPFLHPEAFNATGFRQRMPAYASLNERQVLIVELDMGNKGAPIRYGEAVMRALQSGADMVLLRDASTLPPSITALTFEAVQDAIASGRLPASRIEDAYLRVQRLKAKLHFPQPSAEMAELSR